MSRTTVYRSVTPKRRTSLPRMSGGSDSMTSSFGRMLAKLTGAGFGGCTVTLIENSGVENFMLNLPREYKAAMNRDGAVYGRDRVKALLQSPDEGVAEFLDLARVNLLDRLVEQLGDEADRQIAQSLQLDQFL